MHRVAKKPALLLKELKIKPESHWMERGRKRVLKLFHEMSVRVPAYKNFLKKHKINAEKIKSYEDFLSVPTVDKNNYLRCYPTNQLCWDGDFKSKQWTFSVTSGSTGKPFYFPRENEQDEQYALTAELYLLNQFEIDKKSTLYIDGFAMGAWIGGLFTYRAVKMVADKGKYPLSIITPGLNKREILNAFREFANKFDQIIIGGYPPFVKDLIDEGIEDGIDWKKHSVRFIFSAEGFDERFRDYIAKHAGLTNIYTNTLNHYGTVDLGTMSHETPLSILIRKLGTKNNKLYQAAFGNVSKLPTLTQFMPELFFFEEVNGGLLCSAYSGIPLVRYDLHDSGGVTSLADMSKRFAAEGTDLYSEAKKAGIKDTIWNLPFAYVYERSDFSVSLYGGNIYPETIRTALQRRELEKKLTGKFTMLLKRDQKQNPYLEINTELKRNVIDDIKLRKQIQDIVVKSLLEKNSEYRSSFSLMGRRVLPKISLLPYEHESYFKSGGKQKWVSK